MGGKDTFSFRLKNGFQIDVPRKMMPPFKESFFDRVYLKNFPNGQLKTENPTIIDIGGNVGFFSLFMLSQFPKAKVIAFEPMPFNFQQLAHYQSTYSTLDWTIENKAVSSNRDGIKLFSSTIDGFSTMASVFTDQGKGEEINVETVVFSDVIETYGLTKIDLMKLDCEGSEYAILYGMSDDQFDLVSNFSIETHPGQSGNQNHSALVSFLKEKKYDLVDQMNSDGTGYIWAWR
ncbi:FkbM family methyltransferase [Roseivirga misakiensis]|uniref:Methyltransferase FkbM domain-containing protein n=1 Tax=Roseivirga misakiensis TaxID=1563681 RepID=A0A1E5T1V6_9BACT|nr:FkbM family methyltransferase [Roseivirga misakiensis]OEK05363.1 hypothetical protein BFP71_18400 [Roseivirga misakiensis]